MSGKRKFKPRSFHLQWHITERCNLRCKHCYIDPDMVENELSINELKEILHKYLSQIKEWSLPRKSVRVSLTGGEPLVRDDFFDFLEELYKYRDRTRYGILTNGILLNQDNLSKLKDLRVDYIQVSLEGAEKVNDYIRGEGTFRKIKESLYLTEKAGIPFGISMTVSRINLKEVTKVIKIAEESGADFLGVRRLLPFGRGEGIKDYFLTPKETKQLFLYLIHNNKKFGGATALGCGDGILAQEMHYLPTGCSAGYASFTILPNGDIYPCRRLPIFSGNLLEQDFGDIYYSSKKLKKLRNIQNTSKECKSCPHFHECLGGAKCVNYAYFGDSFAPSPHCWRLFEELPESNLQFSQGEKYKTKKLDKKWVTIW